MRKTIRNLIYLSIGITVAFELLQAFVYTKSAHGQPAQTPKIALPAPQTDSTFSLEKALATRRSKRQWKPMPLTLAQLGQLCWAAQGITDPASGKRTCPSPMGVYALELYALNADGVFHYLPKEHALERLATEDRRVALGDACRGQQQVKTCATAFVITADMPKAEEKLGMANKQMLCLESGHCAQNILLQAVALGLGAVPIGAGRDAEIREVLQLPDRLTALYVVATGNPQ
ncbi:MAG: SagB/ThcOx family dehydrogenase [Armatimonadia bacterium]